jgi:dienelactone hydrolase
MRLSFAHARLRAHAVPLLALAIGCTAPSRSLRLEPSRVGTVPALDSTSPASAGPFAVSRFIYGSGTDRRAAYRDSVTWRTDAVDATTFLDGESKRALRKRWRYWGFDATTLPLNGRVWHPEGDGPFPLVLIVHGNHRMQEPSEIGYEYLAEHLASRGFIAVSVDEIFLNSGLKDENDARAFILLKHLEAWRDAARRQHGPLAGKVDTTRIALIGHSRGGEAAAIAAAFNRLSHYPDDARTRFAFDFPIRAVIAIAPTDGQYRPADRPSPLAGVNYFVVHGSYDADVSGFSGQRTFLRTDVRDSASVKALLYVHRANHGQFNTVWGDNDVGSQGWLLRKRDLLRGGEQRRIGLVFFTAFLELTLQGRRDYEPIFRDHRAATQWLPATDYVSHYTDGGERVLADFDEDVDVTTGTWPGLRIATTGLTTWRERALRARTDNNASFETNTVVLGWAADDTASFALRFPPQAPQGRDAIVDTATALTFAIANLGEDPAEPVDFSIALDLADGRSAVLPLSSVTTIRPPARIRLYRFRWAERRYAETARDHEYVLQRVDVPLARFAESLPGISAQALTGIRFVFDRSPAGRILLDDIALTAR